MIVVTVEGDWGQETIQEILPELKKRVEITLQETGCDDFLRLMDSVIPVQGPLTERGGQIN